MSFFTLSLRHFVYGWPGRIALFFSWLVAVMGVSGVALLEPAVAGRSFEQVWQNAPAGTGHILLVGSPQSLRESVVEPIAYLLERQIEVQQATTPNWAVWSFSDLADSVRLVAGQMPAGPDQAAVGPTMAQAQGWQVGDQITAGPTPLQIVGLIEPRDPFADQWWGDLSPFTNGLLMAPDGLAQAFPSYNKSLRLLVDGPTLQNLLPQADQLATALTNLDSNLQLELVRMETELPQLLTNFRAGQAAGRLAALFMVGHSLLLVGAIAWLVAPAGASRDLPQKWLWQQRGSSQWQRFWLFAAPDLLLAALAVGLGPGLAAGGLGLWLSRPVTISPLAWLVGWLTGLNGWLAVSLPTLLGWPKRPLPPPGRPERPIRPAWWVGLLLTLMGGGSYWQLSQSDPAGLQQGGLVNLGLLLSFSLVAIGLAWLVWAGWAWLVWPMQRPDQPLLSFLATRQLSRQPDSSGRVVALLALILALLLAGWRFRASLMAQQEAQASYLAGADLRLNLTGLDWQPRPGISTTQVDFYRLQAEAGQEASDIVALDPAGFTQVVANSQPFDLAHQLAMPYQDGVLPAIFSRSAAPSRATAGDQFTYLLPDRRRRTLIFEVQAIVDSFPGLSGRYILVNRAEWARAVAEQNVTVPGRAELWLVGDSQSQPQYAGHIINSRQTVLENEQSWLPAQYSRAAFGLVSWLVAGLGVIGLAWLWRLSGRDSYQTMILAALGFSNQQLGQLTLRQWLFMVAVAVPAGLLLAWLLIQLLPLYLWI